MNALGLGLHVNYAVQSGIRNYCIILCPKEGKHERKSKFLKFLLAQHKLLEIYHLKNFNVLDSESLLQCIIKSGLTKQGGFVVKNECPLSE